MEKLKTILFIDDEPGHTLTYRMELEFQGYEVVYCRSVDEAIEWMKGEQEPACIVLDVIMAPGKAFSLEETRDGLDTGFLLYRRMSERYPGVPIVLWTARSQEDVARESLPGQPVVRSKSADISPLELAEIVKKAIGG